MHELLKEGFHVIETVVTIYEISDVFVIPLLDNFLLCMCIYFSVCRYTCVYGRPFLCATMLMKSKTQSQLSPLRHPVLIN